MTKTAAAPKAKPKPTASRPDWPYRFELVPLEPIERLFVDSDYQRPLTSFVQSIANDYNPALVGCLIVSERDNDTMAVVDGQTRLEAMRRIGELVAPCLVYMRLRREDEARLFSDLQTKRRGMSTYLRFRAALVARDPEALAIRAIVTNAGFELGTVETPHTVKAIAALEKTYRRDPSMLVRTMEIIAAAWPIDEIEFRTGGDIIQGIALFLAREKNVDDTRLMDRLASVTPRMLRHRANALQEGSGRDGGGRAGYMADAILGVYVKRGR